MNYGLKVQDTHRLNDASSRVQYQNHHLSQAQNDEPSNPLSFYLSFDPPLHKNHLLPKDACPRRLSENSCKLPTIDPKTAEKLLMTFGEELLSNMLADNIYEFVNLMDDEGGLVFSDRQATRMESTLSRIEFGFGQGGYQPTEFIKRYLPDGFFDLLISMKDMSIRTKVRLKVRQWVYWRIRQEKSYY